MFKVTDSLDVDDEIMDRLVSMLKFRGVKLWILGLVRNDFGSCVDLYFTKPGLPLDNLGYKFLIRIIDNVTNFEFLVVRISS